MKAYEANRADEFWRVIYLVPAVLNLFMISAFLLFIKQDSIMFCISKDDDESAMGLIEKVYHSSEDRKAILANLKI